MFTLMYSQRTKVSSWFTIKIVTNEREISTLLEYFSMRLQKILEVYLKDSKIHCESINSEQFIL